MDINVKDKSEGKKSSTSKNGFLQNFLQTLFGSNNPEAEKKRQLKNIAKNFSKTKFHGYYKPSTIEVTPALGKLLYDIYKIISPAQIMFRSNQNKNYYKQRVIHYELSDKQLEVIEHFDEAKILEVGKKFPLNKVEAQLEQDFELVNSEFDGERVARTENLFRAVTVFKDFCTFDYYPVLKKFSNAVLENNFAATPEFSKLNAEYVIDDLKDFCVVAYAITSDSIIWNEFFNFMKDLNPNEVISASNWKKIIVKIKAIQSSKAFEYMIKHISANPDYTTTIPNEPASIVEPFLDKIQEEMHSALSKIRSKQKESQAGQISAQIFGNMDCNNIRYYVSGMNDGFLKKEMHTYEYCEPLNYLKTFLLEYVKNNIREYYDVVVIRGQWDASLSAPLSNSYQELLKISENITKFDDTLSELGTIGSKIKTLMPKTAHDPGAENIINRLIDEANEEARNYIITSTQELITIGKTMKQLIEDEMKQKPLIVHNWRELEKFMDKPLKEFSVNLYKKIYLFVQLMQQYLQE